VSYYGLLPARGLHSASDTYIEKDALINDEIDRMRHSATKSRLEAGGGRPRSVASVSCIYASASRHLSGAPSRARRERADPIDEIIRPLVAVQYERNDYDFIAELRVRAT